MATLLALVLCGHCSTTGASLGGGELAALRRVVRMLLTVSHFLQMCALPGTVRGVALLHG